MVLLPMETGVHDPSKPTQPPKTENPGPQIYPSEKLRRSDIPYEVQVNKDNWNKLLGELGMDQKGINRVAIFINRKHWSHFLTPLTGRETRGAFVLNGIEVYTDWAWDAYEKYAHLAKQIAGGQKPTIEHDFSKLLTTKRLGRYLQETGKNPSEDPTRRLTFAKELILKEINRRLNHVAIHESEHAAQDQREEQGAPSKVNLRAALGLTGGAIGAITPTLIEASVSNPVTGDHPLLTTLSAAAIGIVGGSRLGYRIDPGEQEARTASQTLGNEYTNLLMIKPKQEATPVQQNIR